MICNSCFNLFLPYYAFYLPSNSNATADQPTAILPVRRRLINSPPFLRRTARTDPSQEPAVNPCIDPSQEPIESSRTDQNQEPFECQSTEPSQEPFEDPSIDLESFTFDGMSYPSYQEMVDAKRRRNADFLARSGLLPGPVF